MPRKTLNTA